MEGGTPRQDAAALEDALRGAAKRGRGARQEDSLASDDAEIADALARVRAGNNKVLQATADKTLGTTATHTRGRPHTAHRHRLYIVSSHTRTPAPLSMLHTADELLREAESRDAASGVKWGPAMAAVCSELESENKRLRRAFDRMQGDLVTLANKYRKVSKTASLIPQVRQHPPLHMHSAAAPNAAP